MTGIQTVVVGAGQAGLAMSRCLTERGVPHVVLERGDVAERWRHERWDSLRLLTPNWMTRLPGYAYAGPDPDGFMRAPEVVQLLEDYARSSAAPVERRSSVRSVVRRGDRFAVTTERAIWLADSVVVATGFCDRPFVPALASRLAPDVDQVVPRDYRAPAQLRPGGVLVVGASATGVQLAGELCASGRRVILAAGHHIRVPRRYRGRDIFWWLDRAGILDEGTSDVYSVEASRAQTSFQLVGDEDHRTIDLATLRQEGVEIVGRLVGLEGSIATFAGDLVATVAAADIKLASLLQRFDRFAALNPGAAQTAAGPFEPLWPRFLDAVTTLDLRRAAITSVVWATGFRRDYPWLQGLRGALDARGEIRHTGGVTPVPGLYVLGLQFLRHRNSSFIDGVGRDAAALADHLIGRPARPARPPRAGRPDTYDAIVVGARAAGAGTALALARRGLRVLMVDRGRHGTDTLSTHALMRGAVWQLARWGVLSSLEAAGTPPVRATSFHYGDEVVDVDIKPDDDVTHLVAPRRYLLDRALADAARAAGADVRFGVTLTALSQDPDARVRGIVARDEDGRTVEASADLVIGADGLWSTVARLAGAATTRRGRHAASTVYGYWPHLPVARYRWYFADGVAAGAIPTNDGETCVFVSVPAHRFGATFRPDLEAGYHRVLSRAAPALAAEIAWSRARPKLRGFAGHAGVIRQAWGPGWALVGDAGCFKDPITAHGITDALRDGEWLARAIAGDALDGLAEYQHMRDRVVADIFDVSDAIASFEWDLPTVRAWHRRLSRAMGHEVEVMRAIAGGTSPAGPVALATASGE